MHKINYKIHFGSKPCGYILCSPEARGEYAQKLKEKFSYGFFGHFFSVDFKNRGYTGKFWVKHLFLVENVTSLDQFLPKFRSQKTWKPCIPIDRSFYPEQKIILQQLLKIIILQVTGGFVFYITRGSKLVKTMFTTLGISEINFLMLAATLLS